MHVEFTDLFNKQRKEASLDIKIALRESLEIFLENPHHIGLHNHSLQRLGKKYFGVWSINITSDYRALYRKENDLIIFFELGTHEHLYR